MEVNPAVLKDIPNVKKANSAVRVDNHAVRVDTETNSTTIGKAAKYEKESTSSVIVSLKGFLQ